MACDEFSERQWYENLHLSKGTVLYIVNEGEDDITRTDSKLRRTVPTFQRVALKSTSWHPPQNIVPWLICLEYQGPLLAFA